MIDRRSIYVAARNWLSELGSNSPEIVAIYEYGTVKAPGLSDLDVLAVFQDENKDSVLSNGLYRKPVPRKFRGLFDESSIKCVSKLQAKQLPLLGQEKFRLICGDPVKFKKLDEKGKFLTRIANLFDWVPERMFSLEVERLKGCGPSIKNIRKLVSFQRSVEGFIETFPAERQDTIVCFLADVDSLRERWFELPMSSRDQSFSCLIKKALLIGELIMTKITHQVNKQHLIGSIPRSKNARYYFQLGKHGGLVSDNINKNNWEFGQSTSESPERVLISVPYVWMYYFDLCSSFRCPISELIDQFLFKSETYCLPEFDDQFREIIKKRIHLCNDLYIFNEQNNFLTSNLFRYGHLKKLSNSSRA